MENFPIISALICLLFITVHLNAHRMRFLEKAPRSIWLSLAGGISVAYVFVHLLPELGSEPRALTKMTERWIGSFEHPLFLIALIGLLTFYGVEKVAMKTRQRKREGVALGERVKTSEEVFWLHVASFGTYNLIIGYLLLHREETGVGNLLLYGFALALHFVVSDYGLREHHSQEYEKRARWWLAGSVAAGWVAGIVFTIPAAAVHGLMAFLAGGIVMNVMKEEMPEEREGRFIPFSAGVLGYATLLLIVS